MTAGIVTFCIDCGAETNGGRRCRHCRATYLAANGLPNGTPAGVTGNGAHDPLVPPDPDGQEDACTPPSGPPAPDAATGSHTTAPAPPATSTSAPASAEAAPGTPPAAAGPAGTTPPPRPPRGLT